MSPHSLIVSTVLALATCAFATRPASAANYEVNSEADVPEASPGNGSCDPEFALPGVCTLRAAIQEANAHAGADTITLSAGQTYTLTRAGLDDNASSGDLDIDDNVTIFFFSSGQRPVVDANGLERAFHLLGGNATLLGFDITGGDATVVGEQFGGAIAVDFDAGIVQLSLLRLYGNRANFGGALYNDGAQTTLSVSELYANEAANDFPDSGGSAIRNRGDLTVDHSSVFDNSGIGDFGAVAISNTPPNTGSPTLTLIDSTIASNLGSGVTSQDESTLVVRNTTVAGNSLGIHIAGPDGTFQMRNSVVAHNTNQDCQIALVAALNLDRYNMDSDDSCELSGGSSNYPGVDPRLTPLARHGGFSHASWPLIDSPTLDSAHPVIGAIGCEEDDQHGAERPLDFDGDGTARCDVGAIEMDGDVIFFYPFETL